MTPLWRAFLITIVALAPQVTGAINISSTSTPTLAVAQPIVRIENAGPAECFTTPNMNATGGSVAIVSGLGTNDYGACVQLQNTGGTVRVFKVRYVSGTNEARFRDVQIKSNAGTPHMKWISGSLSTSETDTWQTVSAGGTTTINVRVKIDSGNGLPSTVQSIILVAKQNEPDVVAQYPLNFAFTAN